MAGLKVFVSSTCYDLSAIRSQLRTFLIGLGHEPVMSEYSDILYDYRGHTHANCVEEVRNADVVVLIVGSRFGGAAIPETLDSISIESLKSKSKSTTIFDGLNFSVTQLEILKATDEGIPVFSFVDNAVMHDHLFYEKNKGKSFINEIKFPSIDKNETAPYIFEFINFLRQKNEGNAIFTFSSPIDIEDNLRKQFSLLFQRLIFEQKNKSAEIKRIENLTDQFEELKTALLASFGDTINKEAAKGVIKYRRLHDVLICLGLNTSSIISSKLSWAELLDSLDISEIMPADSLPEYVKHRINEGYARRTGRANCLIIKKDGAVFECRAPFAAFSNSEADWVQFKSLQEDVRKTIAESLMEFVRTDYLSLRELAMNKEQLFSPPKEELIDDGGKKRWTVNLGDNIGRDTFSTRFVNGKLVLVRNDTAPENTFFRNENDDESDTNESD